MGNDIDVILKRAKAKSSAIEQAEAPKPLNPLTEEAKLRQTQFVEADVVDNRKKYDAYMEVVNKEASRKKEEITANVVQDDGTWFSHGVDYIVKPVANFVGTLATFAMEKMSLIPETRTSEYYKGAVRLVDQIMLLQEMQNELKERGISTEELYTEQADKIRGKISEERLEEQMKIDPVYSFLKEFDATIFEPMDKLIPGGSKETYGNDWSRFWSNQKKYVAIKTRLDTDFQLTDPETGELHLKEMFTTAEGRKYFGNVAPAGFASVMESVLEMRLLGGGLKAAGVGRKATIGLTATAPALSEGASIAYEDAPKIKDSLLKKYVGDKWTKGSEGVKREAYDMAIMSGKRPEEAEYESDIALQIYTDEFMKNLSATDKATHDKINKLSLDAANATTVLNMGTMLTNLVPASQLTKGWKLGLQAAKLKRINPAALKYSAFTRVPVSKARILGTPLEYIENVVTESIEEGIINPMASWYGESVADEKAFSVPNSVQRIANGETKEDAWWGGFLAGGQHSFISLTTYKSRKANTDKIVKMNEYWESLGNSVNRDILKQMTLLSATTDDVLRLSRDMEKAHAQGNTDEVNRLSLKLLDTQMLSAFETGTTEQLVGAYQKIADKSKDPVIRKKAKLAVEEILHAEKEYNDAKINGYENVEEVTKNRLSNFRTKRDSGQLDVLIGKTKEALKSRLDAIADKNDVTYEFTNKGIVVDGTKKNKDAFFEQALKDEDVSVYNNLINAKEFLNEGIIKNEKEHVYLTGTKVQSNLRNAKRGAVEIQENYQELFSIEKKTEFRKKIDEIYKKNGLKGKAKKDNVEMQVERWNGFNVNKQKILKEQAAKQKAVDKSTKIASKLEQIVNKFKSKPKKDNDELAMPSGLKDNIDDKTKKTLKSTVKSLTESLEDKSFKGLLNYLIQEKDEEYVEDNYNMFVLGWTENGGQEDFDSIYDEFFTTQGKMVSKLDALSDLIVDKAKQVGKTIKETAQKSVKIAKPKQTIFKQGIPLLWRPQFDFATGTVKADENGYRGYRLADPNKFNPGYEVSLQIDNDMKLVYYENGEKISFTREEFIQQKFRRKRMTTVSGVQVIQKDGTVTFVETPRKGIKRSHKTYGKGNERGTFNYSITDDFVVISDKSYALLNDPNITETQLHKYMPSSSGASTIDVTIVYKDGSKVNKTIAVENELDMATTIKVVDSDGQPVANIPSAHYYTAEKAKGREAQKALVEARKKIIASNGATTTVKNREFNKIITPDGRTQIEHYKDKANPQKPISERSDNSIVAVANNGILKLANAPFETKKRVIANKESMTISKRNNGKAYELRFIGINEQGQEEYLAAPAKQPYSGIGDIAFNNVITALTAHLSQHDTQGQLAGKMSQEARNKVRETIRKTYKIDIFDKSGLEEFLKMFVMTNAPTGVDLKGGQEFINGEAIKKFADSLPVGTPVMISVGNNIYFAISGQKIKVSSAKQEDYLSVSSGRREGTVTPGELNATNIMLNHLLKTGQKLNYSTSEKIAGQNLPLFMFDNQGNATETTTYDKHLLDTMETQTIGFESGDGPKVTPTNPIVTLNGIGETATQKVVKKPVVEPKAPVEEQNAPINNDVANVLQEAKQQLKELGSTIVTDLFGADDTLGFPSSNIEMLREIVRIPGVNLVHEFELVNNLFNQISQSINVEGVTPEMIDNELKGLYEKSVAPLKIKYETTRDKIVNLYNEDPVKNANLGPIIAEFNNKLDIFDQLDKNWSKVEEKIKVRLYKYSNLSLDSTMAESDQRDKVYGKGAVEDLLNQSISSKLRKFMAGIEQVDETGKTVTGFLGLTTYVNYDEAFATVASIVGAAPIADITYEEAIAILKNESDYYPWLNNFIAKMESENTDKSMRNMFMYNTVKHNISMKFMMYGMENNRYTLRVYDTNSSEISDVIRKDWYSGFNKELVIENDITNNLNKPKARKLAKQFDSFTPDTDNQILIDWLAEIGINVSEKTLNEIRENGIKIGGQNVVWKYLFEKGEKDSGLFGGLAYALNKFGNMKDPVNIDLPTNHPFSNVSNALKAFTKVEAKYSTRIVTISFRDGDKNISGLIPSSFATDRMDQIKYSSETVRKLKADPFSTHSMLLDLIDNDYEISESISVDHLGIRAFKSRSEEEVGDTGLADISKQDKEFTRVGFFQDVRQGGVKRLYNAMNKGNVKMRMARMFFPTMSDKSQMLTVHMPVLDLNSNYFTVEGNVVHIDDSVQAILFEQLVLPELERIVASAKRLKNGESSNTIGVDSSSGMFHGIHQLNNLRDGVNKGEGTRIIELIASNPDKYDVEWFINSEYMSKSITIIEEVLAKEVNIKMDEWKDAGIIGLDGIPQKLNTEYLVSKDGMRFKNNQSLLSAWDMVINNAIAKSNITQLIVGDFTYYSLPKYYNNFGVDRSLIEDISELNGAFTYTEVMDKLTELYESGNLDEDRYNYLTNNLKPLASFAQEDSQYEEVMKDFTANYVKRLALLIAPGSKLANSKGKQYLQIFMDDEIDIADNISWLINRFYGEDALKNAQPLLTAYQQPDANKKEIGKALVDKFPSIGGYFSIESTDGQEYTTVKEHVDILFGQGRISSSQYQALLTKIEQQKQGITQQSRFTDSELNTIFQPIKPVATGTITDKNGLQRVVYVKSSSFPLIPEITQGTPLDNFRIAMEELEDSQGMTVRAAYKTAVKVGASESGINPFDNTQLTEDNLLNSSVVMDRTNFRIQQDVPIHALFHHDDEILIGTQLMKLLFSDGVSDTFRELLNEYNDTFSELTKYIKNNLYKELGLNELGQPKNEQEFINNLSSILKVEAEKRGYAQKDIDGLDIIVTRNDKGNIIEVGFKSPLWASSNSVRYESLLNSIITKRLVKIKLPGYSYVVGSQSGFEIDNDLTRVDQSEMIYTDKFDGKSLKPKTDDNKAQIFVPSRFRANDGSIIDLFQGTGDDRLYIKKNPKNNRWELKKDMISDELLNMLTFRIPTSSLVSSSGVEIAGFLPASSGDLMIVPKEFTIQKGLDYDIDKEYSYHLAHYVAPNGKIKPIEQLYSPKTLDEVLENIDNDIKVAKKDKRLNDKIREMEESVALFESVGIEDIVTKEQIEEYKEKIRGNVTEENLQQLLNLRRIVRRHKKKLLQNKIIRIHDQVLNSNDAEVQRKINSVLSMQFAGSIANLLEDADTEFNTIYSDSFQSKMMELGAAGQMGIGVYSNAVVANSLFQQQENPLILKEKDEDGELHDLKLSIGKYTSNGMLGRYVTLMSNSDVNKLITLAGKNESLVNKIKTGRITITEIAQLDESIASNLRTISEVFAERQNTATDNAKEQIMGRTNVNSLTIGVDTLLSLLGFDKGEKITAIDGKEYDSSIAYFFVSQPIIKEYVKQIRKARSRVTSVFPTTDEIIEKTRQQFPSEAGVMTSELTAQVLYDAIKGNLGDNEYHNAVQQAVLSIYLQLEGYGKKIGVVQKLIGLTTDGLGKSIFETNIKYENFATIPDLSDSIENVTDLFGEFTALSSLSLEEINSRVEKGEIVVGDYLIKPNTVMGHIVSNSLSLGYNLWNKYFPYNNEVLLGQMETIMEISKQDFDKVGDQQKIKEQQKIMAAFKQYLNSSTNLGIIDGNPTTERQRLFKDTRGNPSLASYLRGLIASKHPVVMANPLIKKFIYEIAVSTKDISKIIFDNTVAHDFDEEQLFNSFLSLFTQDEPLPDFLSYEHNYQEATDPILVAKTAGLIKSGKKTIHITTGIKQGFEKDVPMVQTIGGQRFIVTYLGKQSSKEYPNALNEIGKSPESKAEIKFQEGEEMNLYKIEPLYTTRQLVRDLVSYAYLSGGTQGAIEFVRFIPLPYLDYIGYTDVMRGYNFNTNPNTFNGIIGVAPGQLSNFVVQYFQHNPSKLPKVKMADIRKNGVSMTKFPPDRLDSFVMEDIEHPMVAIRNTNMNKGYQVYILVNGTYIRIPTLGTHGMSEYNPTVMNANSILAVKQTSNLKVNTQPPDVKPLPFNIQSADINEILRGIAEQGTEAQKVIAKELMKYKDDKLKINFIKSTEKLGSYSYTKNVLNLNLDKIEAATPNFAGQIVLHEYVHSITAREIAKYFNAKGEALMPLEQMPKHIISLNRLYNEAKRKLATTQEMNDFANNRNPNKPMTFDERFRLYPLTNIFEFTTMALTSPEFQKLLAEADYKGTGETLSQRFSKFISELLESLGINISSKLLEESNIIIMNFIQESRDTTDLTEVTISPIEEAAKLLRIDKKNFSAKEKGVSILESDFTGDLKSVTFVNPINSSILMRISVANGKYNVEVTHTTQPNSFELISQKQLDSINTKYGNIRGYVQSVLGEDMVNRLEDGKKSTGDITTFINHSGGALGADTQWDVIGREFGMTTNKHYYFGRKTPLGNTLLTKEQLNEGVAEMKKAAVILSKNPQLSETINLLARNWFQVKNSTQVNAIAPIADNMTSVEGGTGWAVAMAQAHPEKEVNVFNLKDNQWYQWNGTKFVKSGIPVLQQNFAGIGSRKITEAGKQAIRDVYEKTTTKQKKTTVAPTEVVETSADIAKIDATYQAIGLTKVNPNEITFTEDDGTPCAKLGMKPESFSPGGKWKVIKKFKGASHERGGIDITINNGKIKLSGKGGFEAKHGLVIAATGLVLPDEDEKTKNLLPGPAMKKSIEDLDFNYMEKEANKPKEEWISTVGDKTFNNIVEKQDYWNTLPDKYGSAVKNRETFMELYDKPIKARTGEGGIALWTYSDFELDEIPEKYRGEFADYRYYTDIRNGLRTIRNNLKKDGEPLYGTEKAEAWMKGYYSPEELEEARNSGTMGDLAREQLDMFIKDKVNEHYEYLTTETTYTMNQPKSSWREMIEARDDIDNPALLFSSMMEEGGAKRNVYDWGDEEGGEKSGSDYSGFGLFGLDTAGDRMEEFIKKGYLDEGIRDRVIESRQTNEKQEDVVSLNFTNLNDVISFKNAFMKESKNIIEKEAKKQGIKLTPEMVDYFTVAGYNYGEGGVKEMMKSFHKQGKLKDNTFMDSYDSDSYEQVHRNALKRIQTANMLKGEDIIKSEKK